jgi:hypothetical protein
VVRLLALAMPLTMAGIALFGTQVMGLSLGAALVLGAILAPTDPALAGDLGVGPPGDEEEHEPNFALTAEAGGNDGLAAPLVLLGAFVAERGGTGWIGGWVLADALYASLAGVAIGATVGWVARPRAQRSCPPRRRAGREVPGAGGDPAAGLPAVERRARLVGLDARAGAAGRHPAGGGAALAARLEGRGPQRPRVRRVVRRARGGHAL